MMKNFNINTTHHVRSPVVAGRSNPRRIRMRILLSVLPLIALWLVFGCDKRPKGRLLNKTDVGKVFVAEEIKSHPNFGKYKILISTESDGLYAFSTFDIVDEKPVGKLVVSHSAVPMYCEVKMSPEFLQAAKAACEDRMAQERQKLREFMQKPPLEDR